MTALMLEAALRSLALALLAGTGVVVLRVRNPHLGKAIWTAVLLCALVMPALMTLRLTHPIPIAPSILPDVSIRGSLGEDRGHWASTLAMLYLPVTGVLSLRLALSFIRVWRIMRTASRSCDYWTRGADVRIAAGVSAPITFGATILLPANCDAWNPEKRAAVLAHEREHVRAGDCLVQWLAAVHVCLFWFSPLSWWLRGHLSALAEHSSDDAALREVASRADYAALLLEVAQSRTAGRVAIPMASKRGLAGRINRVLSGQQPYGVPSALRRALATVLVLPAVLLAAATPAQEPNHGAAASSSSVDVAAAHIVATDGGSERWYPQDAKRKGTEGTVRLAVTLDTTGLATDSQIVAETPEGSGFGAAAIEMARRFVYANSTGHPTTLIFNVKFELQGHSGGHYGTTNFESLPFDLSPGAAPP